MTLANQNLYNTTPITPSVDRDIPISRNVRFWFLIIFDVPSTACTIVVLFCMLIKHEIRANVKNHTLGALLLTGLPIQLIDVPLYLNFIVHSYVVSASPLLCLTWLFVDLGLYKVGLLLMTWFAFERHIIVFHNHLLSTQKKRIWIHYEPLTFIIIYTCTFYFYAIYFYPCENTYDYTLPYCDVFPCFLNYSIINVWHSFVHGFIPTILEIFFSLSFLIRVIWHRYRTHLPVQWRKQRKMTMQLVPISILNYTLNFPACIILLMRASGVSSNVGRLVQEYLIFFMYLIVFIMPFICIVSIGKIKKLFKEKIFGQRQRINPT